jgi:homeobox protein cut-like
MRLHDKALLAGSRLIAGSKLARAGIALYVLLLHGVIMALMYYSATPHAAVYESSGSSSIPSAVAAAQGARATSSLTGAAVEGLQRAAAASAAVDAGGASGARLLLRALTQRPGWG